MSTYTMDTRPRLLRAGDVVTQATDRRTGPKTDKVVISTPCCGVVYHVDVADIERHYAVDAVRPLSMGQECGKKLNGRGNQPGSSGCRWPYQVTFTRDGDAYVAHWKA